MSRHAVVSFPWSCQVSTGGEHKEFQIEGDDDEDVMLQVEKVLEQYYGQFFKGKPQEVLIGFCDDGDAIALKKIGDKYDVKISITMMLVPKSAKRKAKREDEE